MKKILIIVLIGITFVLGFGNDSVNAESQIKISDESNYLVETEQTVIIGNYDEIRESDRMFIEDSLDAGEYVLIYDFNQVNSSIDEDLYDEEILATVYHKDGEFSARKTLSSNEKNYGQIKKDILEFFDDFMSNDDYKNSKEKAVMSSIESPKPTFLSYTTMSTTPTCDFVKTEVESGEYASKPYGKIVYITNVYRCNVDPDFDVYMVDTAAEFIPGHALRNLGDTTYEKWDSEEARQKTKIHQYVAYYYGYPSYGEEPNVLEYWPKNDPLVRTISTSFGIGATLGVSQKDGFSGELTANFGYSQSYTTTDPTMSASTITIGEEYGWYFDFSNWYDYTHHFQSGQMVEMENGNQNGTFLLTHDFWFQVDKFLFLGFNKYITYTPTRTVFALN